MDHLQMSLSEEVLQAVQGLDFKHVQRMYWDQHECIFLERFLPPEVVKHMLLPGIDRLVDVYWNYIPRHQKGGSVSYYTLMEKAPVFLDLYHSPTFIDFMDFMSHLGKAPLLPCPNDDPHACALYYYTELGNHIGFHYDTSYYKGARYTALMGLVQRSMPCQLACQLYKNDPQRDRKKLRLPTTPGSW